MIETHRKTSAVTYRIVPCRFGSVLALAQGASLDAVLSHLPTKFVAVTDASATFLGGGGEPTTIERKLMLVNRDHILLVAPRGD